MTTSLTSQQKRTRAAFMAALPGTYKEIVTKSGLSVSTVKKRSALLRGEQSIHIAAWQAAKAQGKPSPIFVHGAGEDARPAAKEVTPHRKGLEHRSEVRRAKARKVRAMTRPVVDGFLTVALMAQRREFPLALVWM